MIPTPERLMGQGMILLQVHSSVLFGSRIIFFLRFGVVTPAVFSFHVEEYMREFHVRHVPITHDLLLSLCTAGGLIIPVQESCAGNVCNNLPPTDRASLAAACPEHA